MLTAFAYAADPREAQITAAGAAFYKCWDTRDTGCLSKLVTDDFVQVVRTGRLVDKAGFLEGMKAGRYSQHDPNANTPDPRDLKIRFYGNTAIQTFVQAGPGPRQQPQMIDHYHTHVWVTLDGKTWLLASMHVSLPLPPPPQ